MLRFFRRIRQKLLSENKFDKYLLYALGEIFLVVIGILIALQINNWNENRKQLSHGRTLMLELMDEAINDISTFNWAVNNLKQAISDQEAIFKINDFKSIDTDSLAHIFNSANVDIDISTNVFEKIKNQGITRLSDNDSLNHQINFYFDSDVFLFNKGIAYHWRRYLKRGDYFYDTNEFDFNLDHVAGLDKVSEEVRHDQFIRFLNLPKTKNAINQSYEDAKDVLRRTERIKRLSIELIQHIHMELSKIDRNLKPLPDFDSL